MKHTLTTERIREIAELRSPSLRWGEAEQIATELLANREVQPVGYIAEVSGNRVGVLRGLPLPDVGSLIYTVPPASAVPTPVNFSENADADTCRKWAWEQVKELVSADGWTVGDNITYFGFFCWGWDMRRQYNEQRPPAPAVVNGRTADGWMSEALLQKKTADACRAAMLARPVSQGCKLPDNVREALTLALQAMEFMGDTLNNIDAVCTEDVEYVTPAFTAVRGLLEAAPEVTVPTTKINCWSCKKSMTTLQLMSSDGICPHCNAEIDTEDDDE